MVKSIIEKVFNLLSRRQFIYSIIQNVTTEPRNIKLEFIMKSIAFSTAGVNVLNIKNIEDATKSTFFAMKELFDTKQIDHCIILDCENFKNELSEEIYEKIWKKIDNNPLGAKYCSMSLSGLFNNRECRSLIVFDKFDSLYGVYNKRQIHAMIYIMAHDAVRSNLYTVQVNQLDKSKYDELIKINQGQKVIGIDLD